MKKILITGILGQDGANMAEYLLSLDDDMEVCKGAQPLCREPEGVPQKHTYFSSYGGLG